ncbi:MAG: hypothetical protein V1908_03845 [Candidatus Peregrinibacteria bacterium]
MQEAMAKFLEAHHRGLGLEQSNCLTMTFRNIGEQYNRLASARPEFTTEQLAVLGQVRESIGQPFIGRLAAHIQELERRIWAILEGIQRDGVVSLMDDEGFRQETFVANLQRALEHMLVANQIDPPSEFFRFQLAPDHKPTLGELCPGYEMVTFSPELLSLRGEALLGFVADWDPAEVAVEKQGTLRTAFAAAGYDPESALDLALQKKRDAKGDLRCLSCKEDVVDSILEELMMEALKRGLCSGMDDVNLGQWRDYLFHLIKRNLRRGKNSAAQPLASLFMPVEPYPSDDDQRGTIAMDFSGGGRFNDYLAETFQVSPLAVRRLNTVEILIRTLNRVLSALKSTQQIKAYLGINS